MLRTLASGYFARRAGRSLGRVIPNPFMRAAALAAGGMLVSRYMRRRAARQTAGTQRL